MKYNMSKIMKRAWELVKKAGATMAEGLKKAWKEAKEGVKTMKGSEKQITWAEEIIKKAYEHVDAIKKHYEELRDTKGERWFLMNNDVVLAAERAHKWIDGRVENAKDAAEIIYNRKHLSFSYLNERINKYIIQLRQERNGWENIVLDLYYRV